MTYQELEQKVIKNRIILRRCADSEARRRIILRRCADSEARRRIIRENHELMTEMDRRWTAAGREQR